jgi:hypothetical protein
MLQPVEEKNHNSILSAFTLAPTSRGYFIQYLLIFNCKQITSSNFRYTFSVYSLLQKVRNSFCLGGAEIFRPLAFVEELFILKYFTKKE